MLGFSVGEWIVTVGVVVVAFGPKDIPIIARGLGKLTGQAVGKERAAHIPHAHALFLSSSFPPLRQCPTLLFFPMHEPLIVIIFFIFFFLAGPGRGAHSELGALVFICSRRGTK